MNDGHPSRAMQRLRYAETELVAADEAVRAWPRPASVRGRVGLDGQGGQPARRRISGASCTGTATSSLVS